MRLATIDVGTNTAQLLVVECEDNTLHRLHAAEQFVRLGEGVDAEGRIGRAARDRLVSTLTAHTETAREYGVDQIVAMGTSALRDAANRDSILRTVKAKCGVEIETLSGEEEAAWSFAAACAPFDDLTGACLVVDIGGGSTELVSGLNPCGHSPSYVDAITDRTSLTVGCVRLTERCFSSYPPFDTDLDQVDRLIMKALDDVDLTYGADPVLIGTAGTATALALVHAGPESSWDALHGGAFVLSRRDVHRWRDRLLNLSVDEIHALNPAAMEGRADVFPVGVMLLDRIMEYVDRQQLRVSPYELRHGIALRTMATDVDLSSS